MTRKSILGAGGTAVILALPVLHAAGDILEPDAATKVCSEIDVSLCPLEPVSPRDVKEFEHDTGALEHARIEARPPGPPSLVPAPANMTMTGYAPEVRIDYFDDAGMPLNTPLPLLAASTTAAA